MKLEDLRRIAGARTIRNIKKLVVVESKADSDFIATMANHAEALLDVVEAAVKLIPSERNVIAKELDRLVGYPVYGELKDALAKLEAL